MKDKEYFTPDGRKIKAFIWVGGKRVPITDVKKGPKFKRHKEDEEFTEIDLDYVQDWIDQYNASQSNSSSSKYRNPFPDKEIEYELNKTVGGMPVHHLHYTDGEGYYEILDPDTKEHIGDAYNTEQLVDVINEYKKRRNNNVK